MAAGPVAAHGVHAGPALVEHQRERVDVGGLGHALALGLLGRHVGERADHVAGAGERVADGEVRDAEVGELGEAGARGGLGEHDHVLRLHVAVDDLRACACARASQRAMPIRATSRSDSAPPRFSSAKRPAVHELRDEVDRVLVLAELVEGDDARGG